MYTISNVSDDFVKCKDEQEFKRLYCLSEIRRNYSGDVKQKIFCIETEETVAGFPDVMELITVAKGEANITTAYFYEFKCSDSKGNIKFQSTQPSFYRQNKELTVKVVAYNKASRRVHLFSTNNIFNKTSPYYTTNARINLCAVEKEVGV